jgi:hypothetical protein
VSRLQGAKMSVFYFKLTRDLISDLHETSLAKMPCKQGFSMPPTLPPTSFYEIYTRIFDLYRAEFVAVMA